MNNTTNIQTETPGQFAEAHGSGDGHWTGYPVWLLSCLGVAATVALASYDWRLAVAYTCIHLEWAIDGSFKYNRTAKRPNDQAHL